MRTLAKWFSRGTESVAAAIMAAMFATFILQITIRYTARAEWIAEAVPILDPSRYGWTLEFCLALWVWLIFWGNSFIVREQDHVTFDVLYNYVRPTTRKWFAIIGGLAISIGFLASLEPTWEKFHILRLKQTATLSGFLGDWIRMRHIYAIYAAFLIIVALRYAWRVWVVFHHKEEKPIHHGEGRIDE
ncbi:TRAP transporter small permease subunit [Rhizobiales bacterium]|uniref:TRAP transporter small permease n=1 Tax=Hongsoonwoonella zoysiae TaxID=2821844 RepID=UPI0015618DA2|nr:TRAP transporter small permease subunit [Hongsoonwoonella zoysiae]NRG18203.1 TRAP transporter small permease subunit [Hongsoonwoonella zoysiae]